MYFAPAPNMLAKATPDKWGLIRTPAGGRTIVPDGFRWIADNGCFTESWREGEWLSWLDGMMDYRLHCIMATAPDAVGDAVTTLERFTHYASVLRVAGWQVGLVAQDGLESLSWPIDYDALFIGGSTEWKLSDAADYCIRKAKQNGRWVHVGRVNSRKRIRHFQLIGVDSCDGTTMCYEPTAGFRFLDNVLAQKPLFTVE